MIRLSDNPALAVSPTDALACSLKKVVLYLSKMRDAFKGQKQLHVNFDPSIQSKEDTTVFIVYSWALVQAGFLPLQLMAV